MLLNSFVQRAIDKAPVSGMAYAHLEWALDPLWINPLFEQHAHKQYTRILLLSDLVDLMAQVVCRSQPSIRQAYHPQPLPTSLTAVYDKLAHLELPIIQALVRETAKRFQTVCDQFQPTRRTRFPGYQTRILDGNVLQATPHRSKVLCGIRAWALTGLSVTVLYPDSNLAVDWFPTTNAYAQERSLLPAILQSVQERQV
jgi:hypothetical protein